jgi:hypothetical protein
MNCYLLLLVAFLFAIACAAPYMTAADCSNFCKAEGKSVASYVTGAQIPIIHPRPSTRCLCEAKDGES